MSSNPQDDSIYADRLVSPVANLLPRWVDQAPGFHAEQFGGGFVSQGFDAGLVYHFNRTGQVGENDNIW